MRKAEGMAELYFELFKPIDVMLRKGRREGLLFSGALDPFHTVHDTISPI
jgi:hypothetical protein